VILPLVLACCLADPGAAPADKGAIAGVVLNRSAERAPLAGATVVLQVETAGRTAVVGETTTDAQGRFRFAHLPVGDAYRYLPGASRDGVHYPGRDQVLSSWRPEVDVELGVYDAQAEPCPLVIRRHDVAIKVEATKIRVWETLLVANPTQRTYVGHAAAENDEPVTLELHIPPAFEQVTFEGEFFGRRFAVRDGRLATAAPWMPGQRKLTFTYEMPTTQRLRLWERSVDLPCDELRVMADGIALEGAACNLDRDDRDAAARPVCWTGNHLAAGYRVAARLGRLPLEWTDYARWIAPLALTLLVGGAALVLRRHRRKAHDVSAAPPHFAQAHGDAARSSRHREAPARH